MLGIEVGLVFQTLYVEQYEGVVCMSDLTFMYLQFLSLVAYAPGCKLNSLNDTG